MLSFSHLHCHTQFSLLDGQSNIKKMFEKAKADGMPAMAITDHGNMHGVFNFLDYAPRDPVTKEYIVKPIIGCEFYLVADRTIQSFLKTAKDVRYHQLFLAKNEEGYRNLSMLCSLGYTEGLYGKFPRIDKTLVEKYHKGLIATTCCLGAEVPQAILRGDEAEAEKLFKWWLNIFEEDYYVEIQRHKLPEQEKINATLLRFAAKYNVKIIASNDSHYVDQIDSNAHDILLCINTGEKQATPKGDGIGRRFGFSNEEFYLKKTSEMIEIFQDIPDAIANTSEVADKITTPSLYKDPILPDFPLPAGYQNLDQYLKARTFEGAKQRYSEVTADIEERLNFELNVICNMGFAGYFIIVQDFIAKGRSLDVLVGPGRGSAAGSAVAYCIGITNIDPIKYKLLFERFLNPERVSMPDIDIDFDDKGREKVINYVAEKYGKNQVAHLVTFGTMAAKSAIKDVARVTDFPLQAANALSNLVPNKPGTSLESAIAQVPELKAIFDKPDSADGKVLHQALKLEGSVRNTGIHASAIVIAPYDLRALVPVCVNKEASLLVTQYDGKVIEKTGLLKMDFLGLKTLTIIKDAFSLIDKKHGKKYTLETIPLDDANTFGLYQRGETVGTFQFESEGMRQHLVNLKPTTIDDLIAMNALYRPGPMQFIDLYIRRKHGLEPIEYPHPLLEALLKDSNGIMVYQEQIMQSAQVLAGYSLGKADMLRRAMGKKDLKEMERQRKGFVDGCLATNNIDAKKATEIFEVIEKFAQYGFNRSHSAAYTVLAFQTAYLKANYPSEYMCAVLTNSIGDISKIAFFLKECKAMGITVLGPDINASDINFSTSKPMEIRFGMAALKGAGDRAVEDIVAEREANGPFLNIYNFIERSSNGVTKKTLEALGKGGGFDSFTEVHRGHFAPNAAGGLPFIDALINYRTNQVAAAQSSQVSLFTMMAEEGKGALQLPTPPSAPQLSEYEKLKLEKELVGLYLSGHPLDTHKHLIANLNTKALADLEKIKAPTDVAIVAILTKKEVMQTKSGGQYARLQFEDYDSTIDVVLFTKDFSNMPAFLQTEQQLYIKGKMVANYTDKNSFEFKPNSYEQLSTLEVDKVRGVSIGLPLGAIDNTLIDSVTALMQKHQGQYQLEIELHAPEGKVKLGTSAPNGIKISTQLLDSLSDILGSKSALMGNAVASRESDHDIAQNAKTTPVYDIGITTIAVDSLENDEGDIIIADTEMVDDVLGITDSSITTIELLQKSAKDQLWKLIMW